MNKTSCSWVFVKAITSSRLTWSTVLKSRKKVVFLCWRVFWGKTLFTWTWRTSIYWKKTIYLVIVRNRRFIKKKWQNRIVTMILMNMKVREIVIVLSVKWWMKKTAILGNCIYRRKMLCSKVTGKWEDLTREIIIEELNSYLLGISIRYTKYHRYGWYYQGLIFISKTLSKYSW